MNQITHSKNETHFSANRSRGSLLAPLIVGGLAQLILATNTYAQSADLQIRAAFEIPISIDCGTDINGGDVDLLNSAFLAQADAFLRSWTLVPGGSEAGGPPVTSGSLAVSSALSGTCTVSGVSPEDVITLTTPAEPIELTSTDTDQILLASVAMKDNDNSNDVQVTHTMPAAESPDPAQLVTQSPGTVVFSESAGTLTVLVGFNSIELPQNVSPTDLAGSYQGTATVEVSL